jgi:hypothetical protein
VQPNGDVKYEEPTAEERELAMGFPRGFSAARAISEHTRGELLGQAMDLNSVVWILAAARAAGERRLALGGDAVHVRSQAAGAAGAAVAAGAEEAQRGQPRAAVAAGAAEAQRGQPRAADVAGAAGAAGAQRRQPRSAGAAGVQGKQPQAAGAAAAQRGQPQAVGAAGVNRQTTLRKEGPAVASWEPQRVRMDFGALAACLGPSAYAVGVEHMLGAGAQPLKAVTVGGGPCGEGWKVGAQLTKEEGTYVSAVIECNRGVFAFSLEEIGEFKLFEVELKLKSEQPIFERRRKHSVREWELVDERCKELEAAGIIEECDSDFAANSVMAAKKDPEGN